MLVDHGSDHAEIAVQQVDDGAGGELLADAGKILDVRKENGEIAALSLVGATADQLGDDTRVDELAERFLDAFARAQLLDHAIERKSKLADFIARANDQRRRNRAGFDRPRAGNQLPQPFDHAGRAHGADSKPDGAGDKEQGKAEISIEPLPTEDLLSRPLRKIGDGAANFG
jgi:hypothetical protein